VNKLQLVLHEFINGFKVVLSSVVHDVMSFQYGKFSEAHCTCCILSDIRWQCD